MILYNFIFIVAAGNMLTVGLKKHVFRLFILLKSFLSNVLYTHIYQCSGINTWIPEEVSQSLKKKIRSHSEKLLFKRAVSSRVNLLNIWTELAGLCHGNHYW